MRLWHRNSLVVYVVLCQSLEFSFAGFQDTSRYFPKPCVALASGQPCRICCLMPKPGIQLRRIPGHKPVFTKALCCFGTGTAWFYSIPCAKARNSASPDSRTQAGISQSSVLLWHQDSLVLSVPYAKAWNSPSPDSRTQAGISQSPVLLWHRNSLVLSVPHAKAQNSALTDSRTQAGISQSPVLLWHRDSLVLSVPCAKAWNSPLLNSETKAFFYFSSSLLIR